MTTATTQYGIRKHHTGMSAHLDPIVRWVEDGKLNLHGRNNRYSGAIADLADLQAKVASAAERDSVFRWEVISRTVTTRTVTEEGPIEVVAPPAPPKPEIDPQLDGLKPGSVVLAKWFDGGEGAWVLSADEDSIPWHGVSGPDASCWASPRDLTVVRVLHTER